MKQKRTFHLVNSPATALTGISNTFNAAVAAFNKQDWPTVGTLLDKDVIVYNISQNKAAVGYGAAMQYFQGLTFKDQFQPIGTITTDPKDTPPIILAWPEVYPVRLTGNANWTDSTGTNQIKFDFQFDGISFRLMALWASH